MTSDLFKDKVYEEMDDFLKLIEPYICSTNNDLARFPDEIILSFEDIYGLSSSKYGFDNIGLETIIIREAKKLNLQSIIKNSYEISKKFFQFKSDESDVITIDLVSKTISGKVKVVKSKIAYDEEELKQKSFEAIRIRVTSGLNHNSKMNKSRMNDVADLFNSVNCIKDRSWRGKLSYFIEDIDKSWSSGKLDIRDYELCCRFGDWIVSYVRNGNLAAYKNLTRIKVMSHQNKPIYSIQEDEI